MRDGEFCLPAEWEPHDAVWLCWPKLESDWPGRLQAVKRDFTEFIRELSAVERVELVCADKVLCSEASSMLEAAGVSLERISFNLFPTDRNWLRDSAPTAVRTANKAICWIKWQFNGWARYENHLLDQRVADEIASISGLESTEALRPDNDSRFVLEGGVFDTDGQGTLLVTEQCLLSEVQCRNPGMRREDYEEAFLRYLGISKTIWLSQGIAGDDTHGHIDDVSRFVSPGRVVLACEEDDADDNYEISKENYQRLVKATDAQGRLLEVIRLPMPEPVYFGDERMAASYANFFIANSLVAVPTFDDENDKKALDIFARVFPDKRIAGIPSRNIILGGGALHCLTQQQPSAALVKSL